MGKVCPSTTEMDMFDFNFCSMSKFDGSNGRMKAVEVFDCASGEVFAVVSRVPFESKEAWIKRAFAVAEANQSAS